MTAIPARIPMADSALLEDCITWGASSKIRIYIIIPESQTHEDTYYERRYYEPKRGHYQTSRKRG